jgi:hypothetical protein
MRRALLSLAVVLTAAVPLGVGHQQVAAAVTCLGKPATQVMQRGELIYFGTAGDDVVVGSNGDDEILLHLTGGTDRVCGGAGNANLVMTWGLSRTCGD